jgi:hypothetical protein
VTDSQIIVDFFSDMARILAHQLSSWGHTVDPKADLREVATLFFNLKRRRIEPRQRNVHVARELTCPAHRQAGYDLVLEKARCGSDLNPHLSRSVATDPGFNDMLMNDWRMHHLHLGTQLGANGLIDRTAELLFAIADTDDIYFVAIGEHGDWAARRLFDAAYENWPHLFAGRVLRGIRVTPIPEADYRELRDAGLFVVQTLSTGEAVFPLGGGSATSRLSVEVTTQVDQLSAELRAGEEKLAHALPSIRSALAEKGIRTEEVFEFHLKYSKAKGWVAVDERKQVVFILDWRF